MKKLALLLSLFMCACAASGDYSESAAYRLYPYGDVKPSGWILEQMKNDLNYGLTGKFDQINNTVNCNLFVKKERYSNRPYAKVGEPGSMPCWWSGEHEGYWKESMIRLAYLTDDQAAKERVDKWVNEILDSTDETGYIGIYADDVPGFSRNDHTKENGELWTQGLINCALLSYYELTGRQDVLDAVEKNAHLTMQAYADKSTFEQSRGGGVSHAVGYFEMLEWLYRITGKQEYRDFTLKMRDDMEHSILRDDDLKDSLLLIVDRKFQKHGAHIGEGFFVPQFVAELTADSTDIYTAQLALDKLKYHLTPTGAMVCDEMIRGMKGNADNRYEYCTTVELINSLDKVMAMRNELQIGDMIEKAALNAMQGGRLPDLTGMSYLTFDNRIEMALNKNGARETYDVCHKAAACCPLNAGRLMPFYLHGMWMHSADNKQIVASLYGPCVLDTDIDGNPLRIEEKTQYPFEDKIVFNINLVKNERFAFVLRKPFGVKNVKIEGISSKIEDLGDRIVIDRVWKNNDQFEVTFDFEIEYVPQGVSESLPEGGYYVQRGPLVFAIPFEYTSEEIRQHFQSGFKQQVMTVTDKTAWDYKLDPNATFELVTVEGADMNKPFFSPVVKLKGEMFDKDGKKVPVELVPVGNTVMRRVAFPAE